MADKPILFSGPMVRALLEGRKTQTRRVVKPQPEWINDAWHWQSPRYDNGGGADYFHTPHVAGIMSAWVKAMPYATADRLWVREAHYLTDDGESEYAVFAVDEAGVAEHLQNMQTTMSSHPQIDWSKHIRLRQSFHLPRWASRLTLVVTDVRVQRVQEISEADAMAEGGMGFSYEVNLGEGYGEGYAYHHGQDLSHRTNEEAFISPIDSFHDLWDSLNAKPRPRRGSDKRITHYESFPWGGESRTETYRGKPHIITANPWVAAYTFTVHKCNIDQMETGDAE